MLVNIIKTYIIYYYGGCRLLCMCDTRLPYIWDTWTPLHVGHTLPYMLDKWIPLHLRHKTPIYLGQMDSFTFRTQSSYTCGTHRLLYMWDKWTPLHIGYMDPLHVGHISSFTFGTHAVWTEKGPVPVVMYVHLYFPWLVVGQLLTGGELALLASILLLYING